MGHRAKFVGLILGVVATATMAGAAIGASTSVTSSNVDVLKRTTANINLNNAATTNTTIVQVQLPPGAWVVSADLSMVNFATSTFVRCGVYRGSTAVSGNAALIGTSDTRLADIATIGAVKSSSSFKVRVRCSHDAAVAGIYADAGATLWAHKSTSLTKLRSGNVSARSDVREQLLKLN